MDFRNHLLQAPHVEEEDIRKGGEWLNLPKVTFIMPQFNFFCFFFKIPFLYSMNNLLNNAETKQIDLVTATW